MAAKGNSNASVKKSKPSNPRGNPNWKKGKSGNPGGQPKPPQQLVEARRVSRIKLDEILHRFLTYTTSELREVLNDKKTPMLEMMVGSIIMRAVSSGCTYRLNYLLERILGPSELNRMQLPNPADTVDAEPPSATEYVVELSRNGKFVTARPRLNLIDKAEAIEVESSTRT